jgi:SAM-dependent methyltransferase
MAITARTLLFTAFFAAGEAIRTPPTAAPRVIGPAAPSGVHPYLGTPPLGEESFWRMVGQLQEGLGETVVAEFLLHEHEREREVKQMCPRAEGATPYWRDPRIHNFGNTGLRGWVHCMVAPIATRIIDEVPYQGVDARARVHDLIPAGASVVDFCCGTGFSATPHADTTGVDMSLPMLTMARFRRLLNGGKGAKRLVQGNAESWGEDNCCDIATIMYGFHEMPAPARRRILRNAMRVARKHVIVVDICPSFKPTPMMLSGEPFVLDYLANVDADVTDSCRRTSWTRAQRATVVYEHVIMWRLDCTTEKPLLPLMPQPPPEAIFQA